MQVFAVTMTSHETQATDPVCGMKVSRDDAVSSEYQGQSFFFCSESCQKKFESDPERVLTETSRSRSAKENRGAEGNIYTCPMHLESKCMGQV